MWYSKKHNNYKEQFYTMERRDSLEKLRNQLAEFTAEREWAQFHSPKNLAMALIAETAEIVEHFQWMTEEQSQHLSDEKREVVSYELADVLIYLIRLADELDINLITAAQEKVKINESRYPVAKVKGSAKRADEYPQ
jgi:dCTP diphosphatase